MELFGGLMIMLWMIGLFLTLIWLVLPFVIFGIKGRVEEILRRIDSVESRLSSIERHIALNSQADAGRSESSHT